MFIYLHFGSGNKTITTTTTIVATIRGRTMGHNKRCVVTWKIGKHLIHLEVLRALKCFRCRNRGAYAKDPRNKSIACKNKLHLITFYQYLPTAICTLYVLRFTRFAFASIYAKYSFSIYCTNLVRLNVCVCVRC